MPTMQGPMVVLRGGRFLMSEPPLRRVLQCGMQAPRLLLLLLENLVGVWGFGFRDLRFGLGIGLRVGFRVWVSGRVSGIGFWVGFRASGFGWGFGFLAGFRGSGFGLGFGFRD